MIHTSFVGFDCFCCIFHSCLKPVPLELAIELPSAPHAILCFYCGYYRNSFYYYDYYRPLTTAAYATNTTTATIAVDCFKQQTHILAPGCPTL